MPICPGEKEVNRNAHPARVLPRRRILATLGLAVLLAACGTVDRIRDPEPKFVLAEHANFLQGGVAAVVGTVRIGGEISPQTCTGHSIYLIPDTPYFDYKVRRVGKGEEIADVGLEDDRYDHLVRRQACGVNGVYRFDGLPEGSWIVLSTIGLAKGAEGPALAAHIKTTGSLTTTANLDQSNQISK